MPSSSHTLLLRLSLTDVYALYLDLFVNMHSPGIFYVHIHKYIIIYMFVLMYETQSHTLSHQLMYL